MTASVFLAQHGHLNGYQVNTQRPRHGMLGHLPAHFRDMHVVSYDDKG